MNITTLLQKCYLFFQKCYILWKVFYGFAHNVCYNDFLNALGERPYLFLKTVEK